MSGSVISDADLRTYVSTLEQTVIQLNDRLLALEAALSNEVSSLSTKQEALQTQVGTQGNLITLETTNRANTVQHVDDRVSSLEVTHSKDHAYIVGLIEDHHGEQLGESASIRASLSEERSERVIGDEAVLAKLTEHEEQAEWYYDETKAHLTKHDQALDDRTWDQDTWSLDDDNYTFGWSILASAQEWELYVSEHVNQLQLMVSEQLRKIEATVVQARQEANQALKNTDIERLVDSLQGQIGIESLDAVLWGKVEEMEDAIAKEQAQRITQITEEAKLNAARLAEEASKLADQLSQESTERIDAIAAEAVRRAELLEIEAQERIAAIRQTNTDLLTAQTALTNADTALGNRIDSLTTTVTNNNTTVTGSIQDVADSVTTLEGNTNTRFTNLQSSLDNLSTTVGTKADATALSATNTKVAEIDGKVTSQATQITNLSSSLASVSDSVASYNQAIETLTDHDTTQATLIEKMTAELIPHMAGNQDLPAGALDVYVGYEGTITALADANAATQWAVDKFTTEFQDDFVDTQSQIEDLTYLIADTEQAVANRITTLESSFESVVNDTLTPAVNSLTARIEQDFITKTDANAAIAAATTTLKSQVTQEYSTALTTAIDGVKLDAVEIPDTRNDNQPPSWYWSNYPRSRVTEFKFATVVGLTNAQVGNTYGTLTTVVPWTDSSGGPIRQIMEGASEDKVYLRYSTSGTTWSAWIQQGNSLQVSISEQSQAIDGIKGVKTVTIDNNGVLSGYGLVSELVNGQVTSAFGVNADEFYVGSPTTGKKVFAVVNGTTVINDLIIGNLSASKITTGEFHGDRITAGTIKVNRLDTTELNTQGLSALSAKLGTMVTSNTKGTMTISGTSISVKDTNGVERIFIGL